MIKCNIQLEALLETLTEAQEHLANQDAIGRNIGEQKGFMDYLKLVIEQCGIFDAQVKKYRATNFVNKEVIEKSVRHKVISCGNNFERYRLNLKHYIEPININFSEVNESHFNKISDAIL